MIWVNVGGDCTLETKDVDNREEYFVEVGEGHVRVGFEDRRPEAKGTVGGVAKADECPQFNEVFAGWERLEFGEGAVNEPPEYEKIVCCEGLVCC